MNVPIGDDRFFLMGVDRDILHRTDHYLADEYERAFPLIETTYPRAFSINLRDDIVAFLTSAPPAFKVTVDEVIDLACFYYSDWDSIVAVADEFIQAQTIEDIRQSLRLAGLCTMAVEQQTQTLVIMLSDALKRFLGVIIGMLSRTNAPMIADYGCCYRVGAMFDDGTVLFQLSNPSVVYAYIEDNEPRPGDIPWMNKPL